MTDWRRDTARRSGAEVAISLRKRRLWFADDPLKQEAGTSDGTENTTRSQPENQVPYNRFKEVNDAKNAAEARLKQFEDEKAQRAQEEALKKGEFEKVIGDLKPKAERAAALEQALKGYLDAEIADIPEDMRTLVPTGDVIAQLGWVKQAKTAGLFANKLKAAPLDGGPQGDGGGGSTTVKLSPEQKAAAQRSGMTDEQFAKAFELTSKKPK